MKKRVMTIGAGLLMVFASAAVPQGKPLPGTPQTAKVADATSAAAPSADFSAEASAVTGKYCVTCHNQRLKSGGLMFDTEGIANVPAHAEVWEKVIRKVKSGAMPPFGSPKPDNAALTTWVAGLERTLDRAAVAAPNPGRVAAVHRLNRTEYPNVIRDLLALDIDSAALLPVEDAGYGFDNVADVLQVSPTLMERYVLAAAKVSRLAMGVRLARPTAVAYMNSPLLWQEDRVSEDLPLGSRGGIAVRHTFPVDGEYEINIRIPRKADYSQYVWDLAGTEPMEVRVDYARVKLIQPKSSKKDDDDGGGDGTSPLSFRVPIKAGPHLLGIDFVADVSHRLAIDVRPPRPSLTSFFFQQIATDPQVLGVQIVGPFQPGESGDTPSRHRILACHPWDPLESTCRHASLSIL